MSRVAVIGAGSWGTTLASLLAEKGHDVSLWGLEKEVVHEIKEKRTNTKYLPGVPIHENVKASDDFKDILEGVEIVLSVVPAQYTRRVMKEARPYIPADVHIISASKGIEKGTLLTVSKIIEELTERKASVLSGPSFAREVKEKLPTAVALASDNEEVAQKLQKLFNTDFFRVYTNNDVLGVELGGALKNVMAIASGISDGLGLGSSARAALITRGLAEIIRLGIAMGAKEKTFSGLSGIGDLVLTWTGNL
jgi:glycerol-3-phosphate dehydrogenase (NAD(P)+)